MATEGRTNVSDNLETANYYLRSLNESGRASAYAMIDIAESLRTLVAYVTTPLPVIDFDAINDPPDPPQQFEDMWGVLRAKYGVKPEDLPGSSQSAGSSINDPPRDDS